MVAISSHVGDPAVPRALDAVGARAPEPARIVAVDISFAARTLAVLRLSDYCLVVVCGLAAIGLLPELVSAASARNWAEALLLLAVTVALGFAAHTGWRHVGVIDPLVWRSYLLAFSLLVSISVLIALTALPEISRNGLFTSLDAFLTLMMGAYYVAIAVPGFCCALLLRRLNIPALGISLNALLAHLSARAGRAGPRKLLVSRANIVRGVGFAALGALVAVAIYLMPLTTAEGKPSVYSRVHDFVNLLACFLFVRARRYFFQTDADALLAVDRRKPVLFLRSFTDDEEQRITTSRRALLDFSLETRLANHFSLFGPFIAIGSPSESVPQPGAARIKLSDDEWQGRVLGWMREAQSIVMYGGATTWVNWELRRIIELGRAPNLILMFPEIQNKRSAKRKSDIAERVEQVRAAFRDTPWNEELMAWQDFEGLRAMLLRADGSALIVKSRSRSRDAYHLASLIAHQQMLDAAPSAAAAKPRPRSLVRAALSTAAGIGLLLMLSAVAFFAARSPGEQLTFQRGELYYGTGVTQAQAMSVGQRLIALQIFNDSQTVKVRIDRIEDAFALWFPVTPERAHQPVMSIVFGIIGADVAHVALGDAPLDVQLSDADFETLTRVPRTTRLEFAKAELYYAAPVSEQDAQAIGRELVRLGFFNEQDATSIVLSSGPIGLEWSIPIDPAHVSDPELTSNFMALTHVVSEKALGGRPLTLHLCNSEFEPLVPAPRDPTAQAL